VATFDCQAVDCVGEQNVFRIDPFPDEDRVATLRIGDGVLDGRPGRRLAANAPRIAAVLGDVTGGTAAYQRRQQQRGKENPLQLAQRRYGPDFRVLCSNFQNIALG
jgi:hypothetical protein